MVARTGDGQRIRTAESVSSLRRNDGPERNESIRIVAMEERVGLIQGKRHLAAGTGDDDRRAVSGGAINSYTSSNTLTS